MMFPRLFLTERGRRGRGQCDLNIALSRVERNLAFQGRKWRCFGATRTFGSNLRSQIIDAQWGAG